MMKVQSNESVRAIRIKNANQNFANFPIAVNLRFYYEYDAFYLFGQASPGRVREYLIEKGVPSGDIEAMEIEVIDQFVIF